MRSLRGVFALVASTLVVGCEVPDLVLPDGGVITTDPDGGGPIDPNPDGGETAGTGDAPTITVMTPGAATTSPVALEFALFDAESDPTTVRAEFTTDGVQWKPLTTATTLANLATRADGFPYSLAWDAATDLGLGAFRAKVKLTPTDRDGDGRPAVTAFFDVTLAGGNGAPTGSWGAIPDPVRDAVTLPFTAADDGGFVDLALDYRVGNGAWTPATATFASARLTVSATGTASTVAWRSKDDLPGDSNDVQLRLVLDDGPNAVNVESSRFAVRNGTPVTAPAGVKIAELDVGAPDWIELVNTGTASIDLRGWTLRFWFDSDPVENTVIPDVTLAAGQRVLVADGTVTAPNVVRVQTNITWANAKPGAAAIIDSSGNAVDFVRFEGSTVAAPTGTAWTDSTPLAAGREGVTLSRKTNTDTDASSDFCATLPSPGMPASACLDGAAPGTVVRMSELFLDGDTNGGVLDWVELANAGNGSVNLAGWTITVDHGDGDAPLLFALGNGTLAPAGRMRLVSRTGPGAANVQYANAALELLRAGTAVSLRDPAGNPVDFARWGDSAVAAPPPLAWSGANPETPNSGRTISRKAGTSTSTSADWCEADATPNADNAACWTPPVVPTGAKIVVSEVIMGNVWPDFRQGAVELANAGNATVDLAAWKLRYPGPTSDVTMELPSKSLAPGARIVFSGCFLAQPPGVECLGDVPRWNANGQAGFVELVEPGGTSHDFVRWGGNGAAPTTGGAWTETGALVTPSDALGRRGTTDTDASADWCAQVPSPGAANNACH